ncbi:MAG: primosomal protein N' [Gammaproteobacteria bacterium]|nr:primosomal protein N' [Gammaproteobacteria bacterium]
MDKKHILQVALSTPLRQTFDYLLPPELLNQDIKVGTRVRVPFGRRQVIGVILNIVGASALPEHKLKPIIEIIDTEPLFNSTILELYNFASQYYQHPIGDVIFSSLPPLLREGAPAVLPEDTIFTLTELGAAATESALKHAVQQQKLIHLLKEHPNGLSREELLEACGQQKALTALLAKGFIRKHVRKESSLSPNKTTTSYFTLNEYQTKAVAAILDNEGFATFLLEGVTGSGKTEVYLQCIDQVLKQNKQALVLVPEIGLTPQTVARFQSRFPVPISILHSGLSDKERGHAWIAALKGISRIIIGTRSAVLTPLPQLGIIVLDEEHDASFKQQSGFRYSAKDLAIMRGKLESAPVLLGSATPCLESLYNAKHKRFQHLILPKRAGNSVQPHFHIIDVRNQKLDEGFSSTILERMQEHIKNSGQVLIFLNRRGFAPTLLCHHCGWIASCSRCDARLTYHAHLEKLVCHHCASVRSVLKQCNACQSADLLFLGLGTQRLEKILLQHFPGVAITRIDRDSTRKKGAMDKMLSGIHSGASQILIGTQMLAKGHHFPDVTMVAIVDVDSCLFSSDFRASERLGQIIVQVAGRAGRSDKPGEVYLQTHNPEHPVLAHLLKSGYSNFAAHLLSERKSADLPPYSHLVLFRAEATDATLPQLFLNDVRSLLLENEHPLQIFGPIPALMEKKAGKFRAQLLIQTKQRSFLQKSLHPRIEAIEALPSGRKVRWSLDVDPIEVF